MLLAAHGGYLPEHMAQQQVMRPAVSAIAHLHAQARQQPCSRVSPARCKILGACVLRRRGLLDYANR